MTTRNRLWLPTFVAIAGGALLAGCDDHKAASEAEIRPVRAVMARSEAWTEFPSQVGEIRPHLESDLGFKIAGRVVERKVNLGAVVRKGDVLASMEQQDQHNQLNTVQADLAAAQASLVQAEAEERRQAQLLAGGWTTKARYDAVLRSHNTAIAAVRAAEARRRLAEDQLGYSVLRAPANGVISAIGAEPGQVVSAGQMVVRLADLDRKEAVFTLAESAMLRLPPSAEVDVRLLDAPQITARGKVEQISPDSDPSTRTYKVKVALSSPPDSMRLGMSVVGQVRAEGEKVIPLPASALFEKDGAPAVWIVNPQSGAVDLMPVTLLRSDADRILVAGGVDEGAIIVTAGVQRLWPGLKVRLLDGTAMAQSGRVTP